MTTATPTLGDRMKRYEQVSQTVLLRRCPVIIRLDGKAFHSFCKNRIKPFDINLSLAMQFATQYLVKNIQGCKFGYTQSDEISLLLVDYDTLLTEAWFDNNLQKLVSVSTSYCTHIFNRQLHSLDLMDTSKPVKPPSDAFFDARAFNIPTDDVCNYFIWRQQDCMRNAITMAAQSVFSHKQLHKQCSEDKLNMLLTKGIDFSNTYHKMFRYGSTYYIGRDYGMHVRFETDCDIDIPDFRDNREYIERFI
jgi:tRNA(His) 5'-end guanylyltransferase